MRNSCVKIILILIVLLLGMASLQLVKTSQAQIKDDKKSTSQIVFDSQVSDKS